MKRSPLPYRSRAMRLSAALLIGTTFAGLGATPARAQQAVGASSARDFTIRSQPLVDAMREFSRVTGIQVAYTASIGSGVVSPGVSGTFAPAEALSRLLTGTGLTFRFTGPNAVTLDPAPQVADGAITLGPVRVEGSGAAGGGIAPSVTSDPDATENTGSFTTRHMSSATKLPLTIRETPQAVTVVTNARMEQENLVDLIDIVDTVPGLSVSYVSARPLFTSRGREVDRITQNGIVSLHDSYVPSSLGNMAMQDRVEVVRGATGLMQGGGNPSGAVNLIRKRPTHDLQIKGSVSAGSWDDYRLMADVGGPITADGRIRARAVGYYQDAGNFRDGEFDDSLLGYITVDVDLTERTTLNVGYSYLSTSTNMAYGGIPLHPDGTHIDLPRSTSLRTDWEYTDNKVHTVYGSLDHDFGGGWSFNLNATYADASTALLQNVVRYVAASNSFGVYAWWAEVDREQKAVDAYVSGPVSLFGRRHEILVGGTINHAKAPSYGLFPGWGAPLFTVTDLTAWNNQLPRPDFTGITPFVYTTHNKQDSLYASGRFSLADPLSLILGARLDWYDRTNSWTSTGYKVDGHLTKYVGLTWDFEEHHSVYVSYTDVFQPQPNIAISGDYLPPVTGKNYEAGVKGEYLGGALNSSLILFRTDETNRAVLLADQANCPTYPTVSCFSASGLVRTWGVDTELQGQLLPGWQVATGFTWSRTRYVRDANASNVGKRLDTGIPTTQFKLSTQYKLPGALNQFTLGGRVNWQSDIYYDQVNLSGATVRNQQDSYAIVDLSVTYRPTEQLSVQLEVNNVFDKSYYRSIAQSYISPATELFGEPRNVLVTLRANF